MLRLRSSNHSSVLCILRTKNLRFRPRRDPCPRVYPIRQSRGWVDVLGEARLGDTDRKTTRAESTSERLHTKEGIGEAKGAGREAVMSVYLWQCDHKAGGGEPGDLYAPTGAC